VAGGMTPDRLRECLTALHWSQRGLGDILGVQERQVRRWATGEYDMPAQIAAWIERAAEWHEANPAPSRASPAAKIPQPPTHAG